ncbi:MAG: hypothetical protein WKG07_45815 [Hymenobacter sp.]
MSFDRQCPTDAERRHHRRRPRRPDGGLRAGQPLRHHRPRSLEADSVRRRDQPHGRTRRLAVRHRWAPLLHQGARGRGALARDPRRRGLPAAAPDEPDLLRRQVLRLPAQGLERPQATSASSRPSSAWRPTSGLRVRPPKDQSTLEGWIVARFGWRLYRHFFKTYTEKLWGVPADQMPADWAAQRIKNLSLFSAVVQLPCCPSEAQGRSPSLIEEFQYPKYGPGMMWERCTETGRGQGWHGSHADPGRRHPPRGRPGGGGGRPRRRTAPAPSYACDHVISSMPIVPAAQGHGPAGVRARAVRAADDLRYRDFTHRRRWSCPRSTASRTTGSTSTPATVQVGRVQNFGSWSPYLVKDGRTCLGLEYFVFEGDETVERRPTSDLIELGNAELRHPRPGRPGARSRPATSCACRRRTRSTTRTTRPTWPRIVEWLDAPAPNVHPVGRNGMHRYNNQDHSMLTAMLTAENIADRIDARRVERERGGGVPRGVIGHRRRLQPRHPGDRPGRPGDPPLDLPRGTPGQQAGLAVLIAPAGRSRSRRQSESAGVRRRGRPVAGCAGGGWRRPRRPRPRGPAGPTAGHPNGNALPQQVGGRVGDADQDRLGQPPG